MIFWADLSRIIYGVRTIRVYELIQDLPYFNSINGILNIWRYNCFFSCKLVWVKKEFWCIQTTKVQTSLYICAFVTRYLESTIVKLDTYKITPEFAKGLEKYLNLESFLEKSFKIKSALKSTRKSLKSLKSPWILLFSVGLSNVDRDLSQYSIVVPLFGAAYAAPNRGTTILY